MSIIGYWKATTGFNVSDYPVTLGKPVSACTESDLEAHPMCGSVTPFANVAYVDEVANFKSSAMAHLGGSAGFSDIPTDNHSETWTVPSRPSVDIRKIYRRTIFVASPSNVTLPQYSITENIDSRVLIVEDIKDPNKLVANFGSVPQGTYEGISWTVSVQLRHTCNRGQSMWNSAPNQVDYEDPDTHTHTYYNIYPVWLYVFNNETFLIRFEYLNNFGCRYKQNDASNCYNAISASSNWGSFYQTTPRALSMGFNPNPTSGDTTLLDLLGEGAYPNPIPNPAVFVTVPYEYRLNDLLKTNVNPDSDNMIYGFIMSNSTLGNSVYSGFLNIQLDAASEWRRLRSYCRVGVYFVHNGELMKPIIKDGIVIGTGTLSEESEIDEYTDLNHPVPSSGGGGGGGGSDDDDMDNQGLGATGSSGGFTQFYVMSPADMLSFLTDFYTNAEPGETLINNLVCSYILGSAVSYWGATENIKITVHNSAQGTPFETQGTYKHVTGTNNNIPLGSFKVDRMTNTFYDFAPYSSYEIFIPCCGWVSLPDTVAGRTIYVSLQIDIATCGAKGVVKFDDGATCAVCSGVLGSSIPLAAIESGLLRGANVQSASATLGGALMAGAGFGSGNIGLGLSGVSRVVDAFTQCSISGNTNFTNQKGSSGDITQFAMGHKCYLKITHPVVDKVVETTGFGHSVGYLCNDVGKLSTFTGFTICSNPHITGIVATDAEKEEIKQLLESGVIL